MSKFKKGDRVRLIENHLRSTYLYAPIGSMGTICRENTTMSSPGHDVLWDGVECPHTAFEDRLELVATETKQQPTTMEKTTFKLEPGMYAKGGMDFIRMICKMADEGGVRAHNSVRKSPMPNSHAVWMCSGESRGLINDFNGPAAAWEKELSQGQFLLGLEGLIEEKKKNNPDITIAGEIVDVSAHSVNVKGVRFDKDTVQKVLDVLNGSPKMQFKKGCFQGTNEQMLKICTLMDIAGVGHRGIGLKGEGFNEIVGMLFDSPSSMCTVYKCPGDLTFEDAITNIIAAAGKSQHQPIVVGGYDAKFDHANKTVSFGCATATLAEVEAVMNRMNKLTMSTSN